MRTNSFLHYKALRWIIAYLHFTEQDTGGTQSFINLLKVWQLAVVTQTEPKHAPTLYTLSSQCQPWESRHGDLAPVLPASCRMILAKTLPRSGPQFPHL